MSRVEKESKEGTAAAANKDQQLAVTAGSAGVCPGEVKRSRAELSLPQLQTSFKGAEKAAEVAANTGLVDVAVEKTTISTTTTTENDGNNIAIAETASTAGGGAAAGVQTVTSSPAEGLACLSCVMGCFGSQSSKQNQDDSKNQKRRSDAITRQLQKDKQVYRATHRLLLLGKCLISIIFCKFAKIFVFAFK